MPQCGYRVYFRCPPRWNGASQRRHAGKQQHGDHNSQWVIRIDIQELAAQ
jgi:hypothetical protein